MSIETKYQRFEQIEHILKRPGMYIGGVDEIESPMWILEDDKIIEKNIKFVPGLYKIFDEIIVNVYDQTIMDDTLTNIKVDIDTKSNTMMVYNDGKGIDVVIHKKEGIYVPELIFGELLTSTHFDENTVRITGGLHGLGAKLTAIFSEEFEVEIGDNVNKKRFYQKYKNNLSFKSKPKISPYEKPKGFVKITFKPDLKYFKLDAINDDFIKLFNRRVYDLAMLSGKRIKTFLNGQLISFNNLSAYADLYIYSSNSTEEIDLGEQHNDKILETCKDQTVSKNRWKIVIAPANNKFKQISFVNGINTYNGGKHVDYIMSKIIKPIKEQIIKKYKDIDIKDQLIRDQIFIIIVCTIENPSFNSQTKDELITPPNKFGSSCDFNDSLVGKLFKLLNIKELVEMQIRMLENSFLTQTSKPQRVKNIPKLYDAYYAGTKKSSMCTLILTEGDSAKAMAISGLSSLNDINKKGTKGNDYYGVFPLKGKLLNVREATKKQIMNNEEFITLQKIIGLQVNEVYTEDNINKLRYGSIILMMDADVDGSHIKGLFINMLDYFWPSLLQITGFLKIFITPMIKASFGSGSNKEILEFFSMSDYNKWKNNTSNYSKYTIKYYKGLGTNTNDEAKAYFKNLDKYLMNLEWSDQSQQTINLAFAKEMADDRKTWLKHYDKNRVIDYTKKNLSYSDFINKELIHFSNYDNDRSIPSLIDGLKPSQRKVLFSAFKKNIKMDIKVAQFVGYVGETTSYHHGEMSLAKTIVSMAQNFVGSNNVNIIVPSGQFGTRLLGGKDYASPRYIYTRLEEVARLIFHVNDDPLLNYLNDDGFPIEPEYYVPILPMILVNGTEGIGTGYSTYVPNFNPVDIIDILLDMLNGVSVQRHEILPWYKNYKGIVKKISKSEYETKGLYKIEDNVMTISELPIQVWTENYKMFLENTLQNDKLKGAISKIKNNSDDLHVEFIIKFKNISFDNDVNIEKLFQLSNKISTGNMYLHDKNGKLKKYNSGIDIINDFYTVRLDFYQKRKQNLLDQLSDQIDHLKTRLKFIKLVISNKNIFKMSKDKIVDLLVEKKIILDVNSSESYEYLFRIPFNNFTKEKVIELEDEIAEKIEEHNKISNTTIENMWRHDLITLRDYLVNNT